MGKKGGWQEFSPLARPETTGSLPSLPAKGQQQVRVQRTKAGKGGKTVTVISGLALPKGEAEALLKQLKTSTGTGGTLKEGVIELQGDQVAAALAALERAGFRPKQAGG